MVVAEVVETKMAYKPNQKDNNGDLLPLGSIQIRIGGSSLQGQIKNFYARPATSNKRIPLIGEQVMVFTSETHDATDTAKFIKYFYITQVNVADDTTLSVLQGQWTRGLNISGKLFGKRLADKEEHGYTFPKKPKSRNPLQPYEGDDLWQGRLGQAIRFTSHVQQTNSPGVGVYSKRPWWKGKKNGDPLMILSVAKGTSTPSNSYDIEDIDKDDSSIYLTSTHKLVKFKPGFKKNRDVMKTPTYDKNPQIVMNSGQLVLNARDDNAFLIAKNKAIISSPEIRFQTKKYNVSLDDLMDYIDAFMKEFWSLTMGTKQFSTSAGPTLTATNVGEVTKLHKADFKTNFKMP